MKKLIICLTGIIDVLLLCLILFSMFTGWRIQEDRDVSAQNQVISYTQNATTETAPNTVYETKKGQAETAAQTVSPPKKEQKETEAPKQALPSAGDYSTSEAPSLGDFQGFHWSREKGPYWDDSIRPGAVSLTDFEAVKGGWKAYLLDVPSGEVNQYSVERLANLRVSGSRESAEVTVDWGYVFLGETGEGQEDNSPESSFTGIWSEGTIEAFGPGKITLKRFICSGDREYAVGILKWPDAMEAVIALVRP